MMWRNHSSGRRRGAFSLLEILVAVVILTILVLIMTTVVDVASKTSVTAVKAMDLESEVRLVFDRLAQDLGQAVTRPDVDWNFKKIPGKNDEIGFWAQIRGFAGNRTLSSVNFRVSPAAVGGMPELERAARGAGWDDMVLGVEPDPVDPKTLAQPAADDYQLLGDQVFRMEICYLLEDGSLSTTYYNRSVKNSLTEPRKPLVSDDVDSGFKVGSWWTSNNTHFVCKDATAGRAVWEKLAPMQNVRALVVGIGVLDRRTRILLTKTQMEDLADRLADAVDGQDILTAWNPISANPGTLNDIHPLASQTVRFYQRYFPLP